MHYKHPTYTPTYIKNPRFELFRSLLSRFWNSDAALVLSVAFAVAGVAWGVGANL